MEEKYHNYCVECLPSYYPNIINTYFIPVNQVYKEKHSRFGREGIGLAFNGVKFDGPASTHAIITTHTIAPLDGCGSHKDETKGYHYNANEAGSNQILNTCTVKLPPKKKTKTLR